MTDKATTSRRDLLRAGAFGFGAIGGATLLPGVAGAGEGAVDIPTDPVYDYFVKVGDIVGESKEIQHAGWIEVLAWQWGATSTSSPLGSGGGPATSKPSDLAFWGRAGIASPLLWFAVAQGKKYRTATLEVVRRGETRFLQLRLELNQVFVTSYQVAPSPSDGTPIDVVRLDYAKARYTAREQKPDGSAGPSVTRGFDFVNNVAW